MKLSGKELMAISSDKWVKVESSNLDSVLFYQSKEDKNKGRLFVKFNNGTMYFYELVPKSIYKGLIKSESKGKYFNSIIKLNYACYKVNI